jgi:hypothetical protein
MCKPMKAGVLPSIDYDLNGRNTDEIASRHSPKLLSKAIVESRVGKERLAKLERRVGIEHFPSIFLGKLRCSTKRVHIDAV